MYPGVTHPQIAVDRSGKVGFDGNVYMVYDAPGNTGADNTTDKGGVFGIPDNPYYYSDVMMIKCTPTGGCAAPVTINGNIEPIATGPYTGRFTDQFQPGVAVDKNGALGICWYDRRNDPANFMTDRYCAKSVNQNLPTPTYTAIKKSTKASASLPLVDNFITFKYSDFDNVASDFTKLVTGFRSGYTDASAGQPDVKMSPF